MVRAGAFLVPLLVATIAAAEPPMRLARDSAYPYGGGGAKYVQTWDGLDVIGGHRFVRRDARGVELWSSGRVAAIPDTLRRVPLLDAAGVVAGLGRPELPAERHARLVVWAPPGRTPRLAYQVVLPRELARMQTLRLIVDADSGALLWLENLVKEDRQARVFPTNPQVSLLTTVTLDLDGGATTLSGAEIVAVNCQDQETCPISQDGVRYRWCETVALATADDGGDFLYERPASDTEPEDEFAEVQMYHHATRALAYFRDLGFAGLREQPMLAVVNLRLPDLADASCTGPTSTQELEPLENALFMPAGGLANLFPPSDAMVFGQGAAVDFAYDGDVVYHELTHAVAATVTDMGSLTMDARGVDSSMAAIHEALADYFSSAIAGDPAVAEYVGKAFGSPIGLRRLDNDSSCAADLTGEEHDDSEMVSGALWDIRRNLSDADRPRLDAAMYVVLDSLAEVESYGTLRDKVIAEVGASLGAGAADLARGAFEGRGFDVCIERVLPLELGRARSHLYLFGAEDFGVEAPLPAVLQLQVTLTRPANEIRIDAARSGDATLTQDGEARLSALVKRGEPIVWDEDTITHDADHIGSLMVGEGDEHPPVNGKVTGSFEPGVYYVQLANAGNTWFVSDLRITTDVEGLGPPDDGGCAAGGSAGGGAGLALVGLLLVALRARRPTRS